MEQKKLEVQKLYQLAKDSFSPKDCCIPNKTTYIINQIIYYYEILNRDNIQILTDLLLNDIKAGSVFAIYIFICYNMECAFRVDNNKIISTMVEGYMNCDIKENLIIYIIYPILLLIIKRKQGIRSKIFLQF